MFAHDIAGWLGIPAGIVIASMIILRKWGMALRTRRSQAREPAAAAGQTPSSHDRAGVLPFQLNDGDGS